jgi:hypothetical protein
LLVRFALSYFLLFGFVAVRRLLFRDCSEDESRFLASRASQPPSVDRHGLLESESFRRIAENLQRYALKHEGRRSDLITEEEWQAPKHALTLLTGHRNVQPDVLKKRY